MTSEVKNNYAYVITQDICNKFIEVNFCVGCTWFLGKIVYSKIEHPSIINKIMQLFVNVYFFLKVSKSQNKFWILSTPYSKKTNKILYTFLP